MLGLWIAEDGSVPREEIQRMLFARQIPLEGFTAERATLFEGGETGESFLRRAAMALLRPGAPLPMAGLARCLAGRDALAGNVLRKYVCLQLSLLPYLRANGKVTEQEGCFLLGDRLLVAPLGEDGRVDALLPPGVWTELATGEVFEGRLVCLRGLNAMPVLAGENALLPIGVNDRAVDADDADRLTLHWFEPHGEASCALADGTVYRVWQERDTFRGESGTDKPWHLIVHQGGQERLIR